MQRFLETVMWNCRRISCSSLWVAALFSQSPCILDVTMSFTTTFTSCHCFRLHTNNNVIH